MKRYIFILACLFLCCCTSNKDEPSPTTNAPIKAKQVDHLPKPDLSKRGRPIAVVFSAFYGCFGSDTTELQVFKDGETYSALLIGRQYWQERTFSAKKIQRLESFFGKLKNYNSDRMCTTSELYKVAYKTESFSKEVTGCDFDDFKLLLDDLSFDAHRS